MKLKNLKIKRKNSILVIILFSAIFCGVYNRTNGSLPTYYSANNTINEEINYFQEFQRIKSSTSRNREIIEEVFDKKISDYQALGYYPQRYEPSLEATYQALYVLKVVDCLSLIDKEKVINYIMSQFNEDSQLFIDLYTLRYLDMDYLLAYYPLNSLLEAQCYALLSLNILDALDLIDKQYFIEFIWSCYNPQGDYNGFIGVPWTPNLEYEAKIATMDNTFYAIQTLDLLLDEWSGYEPQISRIVEFITSLQSTYTIMKLFGGFFNDNNTDFNSMNAFLWDSNLLTAYYCIKTLETFSMIDSIRLNDFYIYLDTMYDPNIKCFHINGNSDECTHIASALALELSQIVGYENINTTEVFSLIQNNRNAIGNWDNSLYYTIHESIATHLIIQSLDNLGLLSMYTTSEKNEIAAATMLYYQETEGGFSQLSQDYVSLDLIHSILSAFDSYYRNNELEILDLYETIEECYTPHFAFGSYANLFYECTNLDEERHAFITCPIEYLCQGKRFLITQSNDIMSVKGIYKALNSIDHLFKLINCFAYDYNLTIVLNQILNSQFLNSSYCNNGAFLPSFYYTRKDTGVQNKSTSLEYTFYSLKSVELLGNLLDEGDVSDLIQDKIALYNYLTSRVKETERYQYFNSYKTSDPQVILKETYYLTWILDAINLNSLNKSKIEHFILDHLDYTNLENVYYSFKLKKILGLKVNFNHSKTNALIEACYFPEAKDFFGSESSSAINQGAFMWICEMAQDDTYGIKCEYKKDIPVGAVNDIIVSVSNLVLSAFGNELTLEFHNDELGTFKMTNVQDGLYQTSFQVPESPKFYPEVDGVVSVYKYQTLVEQKPINFKTTLQLDHEMIATIKSKRLEVFVNTSYHFFSGYRPTTNSSLIAEIYSEDETTSYTSFDREDHQDYSTYYFTYIPSPESSYYFRFLFFDDYHPKGYLIGECDISEEPPKGQEKFNWLETVVVWGIIVGVPLLFLYWRKKRKLKAQLNRPNIIIHNNLKPENDPKSSHTKNYLTSNKGD